MIPLIPYLLPSLHPYFTSILARWIISLPLTTVSPDPYFGILPFRPMKATPDHLHAADASNIQTGRADDPGVLEQKNIEKVPKHV